MSDQPLPTIASTVEGRRALAWVRHLALFVAVFLVVSQSATVALLLVELDDVRRAVTRDEVVEHRVRNEEAHDAQCRILLETARALGEQAGLDVSSLPECPPPAEVDGD